MIAASLLVAAVPAIAYLGIQPASTDLAAQTFRAELFAGSGFVIWNDAWYAGHSVPGYSLLYPPLAALLGPRLVGALAALAAAALFAALVQHRYGDRARLGALWFAAGTATLLLTGRLTFALGVAIGLAALLALQRRHLRIAAVLAALTVVASPVAGLFAAVAAAATFVAGDRRGGIAVLGGAGGAFAGLVLVFSNGGVQPFPLTSLLPIPILVAAGWWIVPRTERTLRYGVLLYGLLCLAAFVIPTPLGNNAVRLGALAAGPLLALVLADRRWRGLELPGWRWWAVALLAVPALYWQWDGPVRDVARASGDPSVGKAYYAPLLAQLDRRTDGPTRIEIPPTINRWEAAHVAPRYALARGWLRQLEADDFDLFTDEHLTAERYRRWLERLGVGYVAVPDTELDFLARDEVELIRTGLPYLKPVWSNRHWILYEVEGATDLVEGDARLTRLEPDGFQVDPGRPGRFLLRVHYTPYFRVSRGLACVQRAGRWTRLVVPPRIGSGGWEGARGPGVRDPAPIRVDASLDLAGMVGRDRSCSA